MTSAAVSAPAATPAADRRLGAYSELLKPRIAVLVVVTTALGFALGVRFGDIAAWTWLGLLGSLAGTAASCMAAAAFNQALEHRTDGLMRRTAARPLPSGRLTRGEAWACGGVLALPGQGLLCTCGTPLASLVAGVTILLYAGVYTPLKRITSWSVWIGAVPGALPPVIGFAAATAQPAWAAPTGGSLELGLLPQSFGHLTPVAWLPFLLMFFWQIPHFLAIAYLYRSDYAAAGMPMVPVLDARPGAGGGRTGRQAVIGTLLLLGVGALPFSLGVAGGAYLLVSSVAGLAFAWTAWRFIKEPSRATARALFLGSLLYLPVVLGVLVLDLRTGEGLA